MVGGREVPIEWNGRRALAWVPDLLSGRDVALTETTVRATERAAAAARRASDGLPQGWEPIARLLLRAEGVASSAIEGVRAPLADIAAAELDQRAGDNADWVARNLAVVAAATTVAPAAPMTPKLLDAWHTQLMVGSWLPAEMIGRYRAAQGWIGGTSPLDAALVTAPPALVPDLMDDLIGYLNRDDVDPVTQASVAHAQFECIHPYGDGNGRIGRVLVGWLLVRRLGLTVPPPTSVLIATDSGGYLAGLTQFRLGDVDLWVRWFGGIIETASAATLELVDHVHALTQEWRRLLGDVRADSAAHRLVALLPQHPVLSAASAAGNLNVSERTARTALATLAEHGIVEPFASGRPSQGRPRNWWVAPQLLTVVSSWAGT